MTRPIGVATTTSAQPEPSSVPLAQQEPDVATDPPEAVLLEANQEPLVTTETKKKKKKSKKN